MNLRGAVQHSNILQGYSKSGLMGFADVAVDEEKVLVVHFLFQKHPYSVTVSDQVPLFEFLICHTTPSVTA